MLPEKQACTARVREITQEQLPLSCPVLDERVWDAHPRVYLPIEALGEVTCPYCNTRFYLKTFSTPNTEIIKSE